MVPTPEIAEAIEASVPPFIRAILSPAEQIVRISKKGLHSDAIIFSDRLVIKCLGWKRHNYPEAALAAQDGRLIQEYFRRLRALSPNLAPGSLAYAVCQRSGHGSPVCLVLAVPYKGQDTEDLLKRGVLDPATLARILLSAVRPLLSNLDTSGRCLVGIDPKPANFCQGEDGNVVFIDFVPPRFRQDDGSFLVDAPIPRNPDAYNHLLWKYFTPRGILANLLAQICRIKPEAWHSILDALVSELEEGQDVPLAEWLREVDARLLDQSALQEEVNPLMLRLNACKLASQSSAMRQELGDFFSHISRYEDDDLMALVNNARSYLLQRLDRGAAAPGATAASDGLTVRCVTFLLRQQRLNLQGFRVFGQYMCSEVQLRGRLLQLADQVGVKLVEERPLPPTNMLLCGPPGIGKTFLVGELAKHLYPVSYAYCKLSDYPTIQDGLIAHLAEIIIKSSPGDAGIIACLDEFDVARNGEHVCERLLGPMAGDDFAMPGSPGAKSRLTRVVWFFLTSGGDCWRDFERRLDGISKGPDFLNRIPEEYRIDLPCDSWSPEEGIVRAAGMISNTARNLDLQIGMIEGAVLAYFGLRAPKTAREVNHIVRESLRRTAKGARLLRYDDLAVAPEAKYAFWTDLIGKFPDIAKLVIELC